MLKIEHKSNYKCPDFKRFVEAFEAYVWKLLKLNLNKNRLYVWKLLKIVNLDGEGSQHKKSKTLLGNLWNIFQRENFETENWQISFSSRLTLRNKNVEICKIGQKLKIGKIFEYRAKYFWNFAGCLVGLTLRNKKCWNWGNTKNKKQVWNNLRPGQFWEAYVWIFAEINSE